MRNRNVMLAGAGIGLAGVTLSGFPNRVGVTRSQSDLSLPGDLLLPIADLQADRAHEFAASPDLLWPELLAVEDLYSFLWERPLTLLLEEPGELLVWRSEPGEDWVGTLTAALLPGTDGHTTVHLRERYRKGESYRWGRLNPIVLASALAAPATWFRFRRAVS